LRDVHEICEICTRFNGFSQGVTESWGVKLRVSGLIPPNIQRPIAAKLCVGPPSVLGVLYHHAKFGGLAFHRPKTLSLCLFVCLFITLVNVRVCVHDFAMKALEYINDFDAVR